MSSLWLSCLCSNSKGIPCMKIVPLETDSAAFVQPDVHKQRHGNEKSISQAEVTNTFEIQNEPNHEGHQYVDGKSFIFVPKYYPPASGGNECSLLRTLLYDECFSIKHLQHFAAICFACVVHLSLKVGTTFFSFGMPNYRKIPGTQNCTSTKLFINSSINELICVLKTSNIINTIIQKDKPQELSGITHMRICTHRHTHTHTLPAQVSVWLNATSPLLLAMPYRTFGLKASVVGKVGDG